jgi:hypothetical protein
MGQAKGLASAYEASTMSYVNSAVDSEVSGLRERFLTDRTRKGLLVSVYSHMDLQRRGPHKSLETHITCIWSTITSQPHRSPVWDLTCSHRWPFVVKHFPQCSQRKGFSPVCFRMCTLRLCRSANSLWHWGHSKGLTPAYVKVVIEL